MADFPKWKTLVAIVIIIISIVVVVSDFYLKNKSSNDELSGLKLGLDLKGGSYLVLEVDETEFLNDYLNSISANVRGVLTSSKISYLSLAIQNNRITVNLVNSSDFQVLKDSLLSVNELLDISNNGNLVFVTFSSSAYNEQLDSIIESSIEVIRNRVDQTGTNEPSIKKQGDNQIVVELPGVENPTAIKRLLGTTARLTFHRVDEAATNKVSPIKAGYRVVRSNDIGYNQYVIQSQPALQGKNLVNAKVEFVDNRPIVSFIFDTVGARQFADLTTQEINKSIAIVLDNVVITAPRVNTPITGGSGMITGNFSLEEAQELAILLRAGSLPVPLDIVEERTVGPTLGADSIKYGIIAGIIGYLAVFVFMIMFYKKLGLIANIALLINLVFIVAALSLLEATLTLPGIAGIILSIGMAVDANILVYERYAFNINNYKLEKNNTSINSKPLSENKIRNNSLKLSFERVFLTILDSNITTLFVALFLFGLGSGPIRGFAVTLIIGIITSLFSIMYVSRFLINVLYLKKN